MRTGEPEVWEIPVPLFVDVRVSVVTGDVLARVSESEDRVLLAGHGPLRSASGHGGCSLLLETVAGERWLVVISEESGLVASVEPVPEGSPAADPSGF